MYGSNDNKLASRRIWRPYWFFTECRSAGKELASKVAEIEVLVAGAYVRKDEFIQSVNALFARLDRIEDKLDKKVDK